MNSDQARQRAEKRFKQEERARDGQKAMIEYEIQARATREKTARLKALRLATSRRKIDAFSIVVNSAWQRKTRRGNRRGVPRSMCRGD